MWNRSGAKPSHICWRTGGDWTPGRRTHVTRKCGNYSCIATCSLVLRSNSLELAHTLTLALARPPVGLHYPALDEFARSPTGWLAHVQTRSLSLELSRTRSPGAAKPVSFHSLPSYYSSNEWNLLRSYQILWKYLDRCRKCDRKTKFKRMPTI